MLRIICILGMPRPREPADLQADLELTVTLSQEERARAGGPSVPTPFSGEPDTMRPSIIHTAAQKTRTSEPAMISAEELDYLHSKFPSLKGTPDSILRKMDFTGILMLHDALGKESRDAYRQDTGQKLASNAAAMRELSTIVETGEDNRFDKLHPCRFIGGAGCSSQAMWLRAREILGNKG